MNMNIFLLIASLSSVVLGGEFRFTPHQRPFDPNIEHLTAQLVINGTTEECLVDTGARYTIARVDVLKDLEKVGEIPGGGLSNPNINTDLVQTNLILGDWKMEQALVGRSDRIPFRCLIGNDFFLKRSFSLDFKKNLFIEIDSPMILGLPLNVYKNHFGGHFGFDVIVAGQSTQSIFDTGASQTVIDDKLVEQSPDNFVFIKDLSATDGNNTKIKAVLYRLKRFNFANLELKDIEVIAVDLSNLKAKLPQIDVVIGMDIIQNFTWTFDTQQRLWSFTKE